MNFEDLLKIYEKAKKKYGKDTYKFLSKILSSAKKQHEKSFIGTDHEQSWRAFKGKNLEKLIQYIITDQIQAMGLALINGNTLEKKLEKNLSNELSMVKRNLYIDYGKYGAHLPDVDIVIYKPETSKIIALLSIKVTLRERIAQTGYWKLKLLQAKATKHIKMFFITLDEDSTLTSSRPAKKGRAIVEVDTDSAYILTEKIIEESNKIKLFNKLFSDIQNLVD